MDDLEIEAEISASEDENEDDRNHGKLLDAISSLDGKKKTKLHERTVYAPQISEYNFTSQNESNKINISELMGTLTSANHGKLKKQLKSVESSDKVVSVPLPKHEKQKIDRSVAYEQTAEEVSKWNSIVMKNRVADQLKFPLDSPVLKLHTTDQHMKAIKPRTSLELEVAALLKSSENVPKEGKELTPAEERALKAMDLEEAKERLAELRKHRALLSYKEAKAKWQKRIKSKKYHRVLKKERLKNEKKSLEELQKSDPEGYLEKVQSVEKQRVEERMSLKHRGGSKYMKKQMIYGKYNDQARQAVQDMIQKNKELTHKTEVFSDSESEGGVSMDSEDEMTMLESAIPSTNNPWMKATKLSKPSGYEPVQEVLNEDKIILSKDNESETESKNILGNVVEKVIIEDNKNEVSEEDESESKLQNVEIKSSEKKLIKQNGRAKDVEISDNIDDLFKDLEHGKSGDETIIGSKSIHERVMSRNSSKSKKKRRKKEKEKLRKQMKEKPKQEPIADVEKDEKEEEEESFISEKLSMKRTIDDFEGSLSEDDTGNDIRTVIKRRIEKETKADSKPVEKQEDVYVDPKKLLTLESKLDKTRMPDMVVDDNDIDNEDQQKMTIAQAFADDDVIEEFSQEKKDVMDRDKPKDIDLTLPGWGEWGGQGLKMSKRKKRRFIIKAPPGPPRKDSNLGNVIISEQKDKAIAKYQVSDLPFPYINVKQFEQSIRAPIGKTWNPETAFKQLVRPKIVTKVGAIIKPIDKEETFKKEKSKRKADLDLMGDNSNNTKRKKK